ESFVFVKSKKLNHLEKKIYASVQDMPSSGTDRPFDAGLVKKLPQNQVVFQPQRFCVSREDAAHVVELGLFDALGSDGI
ncbi:MAG: hypothetical protein ACE5LV_08630, partial [Candidatus Aminicenantales bacterium]